MRTFSFGRVWGVYLLLAILVSIHTSTLAADEVPPPPHHIRNASAIIVGVTFDEAAVKRILPASIKAAPGATGVVKIYTVPDSYGLGSYTAALIQVDVLGFDAPGGMKGRSMLAGLVSPAKVADAGHKIYGWTAREGTARFEMAGGNNRAIVTMGGKDVIVVEIKPKGGACETGSGQEHEPNVLPDGKVGVVKFTYVGTFCGAEPVKVEITAPPGDPLSSLKPVKLNWAASAKDFTFSLSAPVSAH